jgi:hypothetical protein
LTIGENKTTATPVNDTDEYAYIFSGWTTEDCGEILT